jgi:hypothetical protein
MTGHSIFSIPLIFKEKFMSDYTGLIAAYILDGKGEGKKIGWEEIKNWNLKLVLEVLYTMKVCY